MLIRSLRLWPLLLSLSIGIGCNKESNVASLPASTSTPVPQATSETQHSSEASNASAVIATTSPPLSSPKIQGTEHRFEQFQFTLPERFERKDTDSVSVPPNTKVAVFANLNEKGELEAFIGMNLIPNSQGDSINMRKNLVSYIAGTCKSMKLKVAGQGKDEIAEWNGMKFTYLPLLISLPDGNVVGGMAYGAPIQDQLLLISHFAFAGEPPQIIDEIKDCIANIRLAAN